MNKDGAMQEIEIPTTEGAVTVEAEVYGLWALTPRIGNDGQPDEDYWTYTHVPTGMSLLRSSYVNKPAVREFVRSLSEEFTAPTWETEDPATVPQEERGRFVESCMEFREKMEPAVDAQGRLAPWYLREMAEHARALATHREDEDGD